MTQHTPRINQIVFFIVSLFFTNILIGQSIEITSFTNNPVEVNPLIGGNVTVSFIYTSETGSTENHIYIGLEILDASNTYQSTVTDITLNNQSVGNNTEGSVDFFIGSSNKLSTDLPTGHYYQVKATLYASGGWAENAWAGHWNTPALTLQDTSGTIFSTNSIAKGADVSWMTEMEADGYTWKDNSGTTRELMPLLTEYQLNAIRLRVWVNPSVSGANGWCDIEDVVSKAKLANEQNIDILISIHYSDYWADPGTQNKPAAWSGFSVVQLETAVANHTTAILTALNTEGITPKWVQIGNETSDGMLWTTGKASTGGFANYAKFINAGTASVKNFDSTIKTILHLAEGDNNTNFRWNIDGLKNNGLAFEKLDIIGMSLYPEAANWIDRVDDTYANMIDLKSRYNKEVMIAEVGFSSSTPDIAHQFLVYMIEKTRQANGLGVFYWEPISHNNWKSYSKGAWDSDGSPSIAMNAFIDRDVLSTEQLREINDELFTVFPNPSSKTVKIRFINTNPTSVKIYSIRGQLVKNISFCKSLQPIDVSTFSKGFYIFKVNGKGHHFLKI